MVNSQGLKLRDLRARGHFTVDNEMVDEEWIACIGSNSYTVYSVLCRFANINTSSAFPSYELISQKTGISRREVIRCIHRLEDHKLISIPQKVKGRGKTNTVDLLDRSEWIKLSSVKCDTQSPFKKSDIQSPLKKGDNGDTFYAIKGDNGDTSLTLYKETIDLKGTKKTAPPIFANGIRKGDRRQTFEDFEIIMEHQKPLSDLLGARI